MVRRVLFLGLALLAARGFAADPAVPNEHLASRVDAPWSRVDVAPTWTSIYIGTVSMKMPTFQRQDGRFSAPYAATVFPYFFYNEKGTLTVDVSDEQLHSLADGKQIEFTGTAVNSDGEPRKVTARATPKDPASGKLDVHVWVSKRIQLIFHTTYRFAE